MVESRASSARAGRRIEIILGSEDAGLRLDRALQRNLPELSRTRLKQLILSGQVARPEMPQDQILQDPAQRVHAGQSFVLTVPDAEPASPAAQPIPLEILFEDAH